MLSLLLRFRTTGAESKEFGVFVDTAPIARKFVRRKPYLAPQLKILQRVSKGWSAVIIFPNYSAGNRLFPSPGHRRAGVVARNR